METTAIRTLETLLDGLIDYAGLFPPAQLDMASAVAEYHRQRRGPDSRALARFIVPVGRLDEFEREVESVRDEGDDPWPLSVLPGEELEEAQHRLEKLPPELARAEAAELRAASVADVERAAGLLGGLELYFELAVDDKLDELLGAVARHGAAAKIRTGAVTQDGIPSPAEVARFLLACQRAGVAFKATAGLHHPLRGEYPLTYEDRSPSGTMHGFLNVFLTAAFLDAGKIEGSKIEVLLGERSVGAFAWNDDGVTWMGHHLTAEELARARRRFARSYGSCSFTEPIDELRELELL